MDQYPLSQAIPGYLILRIDAPIFFANSSYLRERLVRSKFDICMYACSRFIKVNLYHIPYIYMFKYFRLERWIEEEEEMLKFKGNPDLQYIILDFTGKLFFYQFNYIVFMT